MKVFVFTLNSTAHRVKHSERLALPPSLRSHDKAAASCGNEVLEKNLGGPEMSKENM